MGYFGNTWKSPFFVLWPLGQKWRFSSFTKIPHVGTLNLCQKMPDKMQMDSGQSDHSILRKRPKWPKMAQKWPIFNTFWMFSQDWMIYLLEKKPRSILTPFLTISVMNWAPRAYICPLMRYWHFETIFGLELQQNPSAGRNFIHTLIWPNLTLFWKKKWNLRCGVAAAAKIAKNGHKMTQKGQTIKYIILA